MNWTKEELEKMLKDNPDLGIEEASVPLPTDNSPSKYHNRRTEYKGVVYQSEKEAQTAMSLDLLIQAGEIDFYLRQVPFDLGGSPKVQYRADFVTFDEDALGMWWIEIIEAKGMWTEAAKLKMKLFREKYPSLKIRIV